MYDIIWDTTFQSELQNSLINLIINWDDLSYLTPIESAQTYPTIVIQSSNYRGITQAPAAALDNSKIGFEVRDGSPLPKALGWISSRQEPMSLMSLSTGFILRSDFQKKQFRVAGWNASLITVEIIFPAVWWSNLLVGFEPSDLSKDTEGGLDRNSSPTGTIDLGKLQRLWLASMIIYTCLRPRMPLQMGVHNVTKWWCLTGIQLLSYQQKFKKGSSRRVAESAQFTGLKT